MTGYETKLAENKVLSFHNFLLFPKSKLANCEGSKRLCMHVHGCAVKIIRLDKNGISNFVWEENKAAAIIILNGREEALAGVSFPSINLDKDLFKH